ncbi:hypothetical protein MAR_009111 [Mya arenaria]|uniref:Kazal-like domain-containing protein n=1 Tax=Mya arenaria TaxID=6604 RepID=A0ABY7DXU4_MYAAR|nr:hypothetical protein MAR_009111 [Mya arenaria]
MYLDKHLHTVNTRMRLVKLVLFSVVIGLTTAGKEEEVNAALDHVNGTYQHHLCDEIKKLHCDHLAHHIEVHVDGAVCEFAKSRCYYILNHNNYYAHSHIQIVSLNVHNLGPCPARTTAPPTPTIVAASTQAASMVGQNLSSSPPTTTVSATALMMAVFCLNKATIPCNSGHIQLTCGSDGRLYPNPCELLKEQCNTPNLATSPLSVCGA